MTNLAEEIRLTTNLSIATEEVLSQFLERLREGNLTRDENPVSHFCTYFLPYDQGTKKVFIVHHKKSGLWISPGGHIDEGENLIEALNREIQEELGFENKEKNIKPFLLTITPIENPLRSCKEHFDIWYRIPTDGSNFHIDLTEFHTTRWLSIDEARELATNKQNLEALDKIEKLFDL